MWGNCPEPTRPRRALLVPYSKPGALPSRQVGFLNQISSFLKHSSGKCSALTPADVLRGISATG